MSMFAELLGSSASSSIITWVLFTACSRWVAPLTFGSRTHIIRIWLCQFSSCLASKSSVGWVFRRLLPLHHFRLMHWHPFRSLPPIRSKLGKFSLKNNSTWPRWSALWDHAESPEIHGNPAMKDQVELPGDFQVDLMQNGEGVWVVIFLKNPSKIINKYLLDQVFFICEHGWLLCWRQF